MTPRVRTALGAASDARQAAEHWPHGPARHSHSAEDEHAREVDGAEFNGQRESSTGVLVSRLKHAAPRVCVPSPQVVLHVPQCDAEPQAEAAERESPKQRQAKLQPCVDVHARSTAGFVVTHAESGTATLKPLKH
jgi:hypothetical protein